ncbi:DUF1499 domain-containing protein [Rhodosalinus sp. 5P4]|uniref:DUF1499 domain-containing protein n=1 Tax=Rhodosalinus sp. 5P4 TaxID=3239196 RepID=UPI0035265922
MTGVLKILFWFAVLVLLVVVNVAAWVRFAPTDVARWHAVPQVDGNEDLPGGVKRRVAGAGAEGLAAFDRVARAAPRTRVLAGSPQEGRITYVSRSRVFGFPDYTTVALDGEDLVVHGRLRFGQSDLGVNKARVDGWLSKAGLAS